jgi:SPP1 gp7 family putative phage head morphogenesis protein
MAKKLKLTAKREAWAASRRQPPVFQGETLTPNVAPSVRYVQSLQSLTAQMTQQVKREIIKLFKAQGMAEGFTQDASIASQSRILMTSLADKFNDLFGKRAKPLSETMVAQVEKTSSKSLHSSLAKLSGGMSLSTASLKTPFMRDVITATVAENVGLIKSISADYLMQVQGEVMRSITTGRGLADLVPAIEKYEGQTHRRAKNIALDQTRKAYNNINRAKLEAIGVKQFMWIHSGGGAHPREDHVRMDGQIYDFDNPPIIDSRTGERGIPGQAVNCKCTMKPIFNFGAEK